MGQAKQRGNFQARQAQAAERARAERATLGTPDQPRRGPRGTHEMRSALLVSALLALGGLPPKLR